MNTTNFGKNILNQAQTQLIGQAVLLGEDAGKRKIQAILKAAIQVRQNRTIEYNAETRVLNFRSVETLKNRIVTASGCSDQCECKNAVSYHTALFELIEAYLEIEKTADVLVKEQGVVSEIYRKNRNGSFVLAAEKVGRIVIAQHGTSNRYYKQAA